MLHHDFNPTLQSFNIMTLSLTIILFELFIILFNYKYQYVIIMHHYLSASPQPNRLLAWVSSLELEFLNGYKAFHYIHCFSYNLTLWATNATHFSYRYAKSQQSVQYYTPADNCSVGLRSCCNTYCLQPYTALFVFVFMAETLHSSFFKGF